MSNRLLYMENRSDFIKIMTSREKKNQKKTYHSDTFSVSITTIIPTDDSKQKLWSTGVLLRQKFPHHDIEWIKIKRNERTEHSGAIISMNTGKFLIFRNGNNASRNNFCCLDYQTKRLYFRSTKKDIVDLLGVISAEVIDLPLLYGWDLNKEQKDLLLKKIEGEHQCK
jgi:hypothetical protein